MSPSPITSECVIPSDKVAPVLSPDDEFLISTSEFVAPATPVSYVKNKGVYLLFKFPEIHTTLLPEMGVWFNVTCLNLRARLTFKGQVYKIVEQTETTLPCIIVKITSEVTAVPHKFEATLAGCEIPVVWRKTGSMKQGTITQLTARKGIFETSTLSLAQDTRLTLSFSLGDYNYDELTIIVDRASTGQNKKGNSIWIVQFSFINSSESTVNSLTAAIESFTQN